MRAPRLLAAPAAYAALALLVTLPLALRLDSALWGHFGQGDLELWLWHDWWTWKLVGFFAAEDPSPADLLRRILSIPVAYNDTGNMLDLVLLSWPLNAAFGLPASYNLKCLVIFTANGLAMHWLLRRLEAPAPAALAGGALFAFNPYTLHEVAMGRPMQALVFFLPLVWGFWLRLLEERRPAPALVAGALLGLASATYWYYGIFLVLLSLAHLAWRAARRQPPASGWPARLALALVAAAVVAGPFAAPILERAGRLPGVRFMTPFPSLGDVAAGRLDRYQFWVLQESEAPGSFMALRPEDSGPVVPVTVLILAGLGLAGPSPWRPACGRGFWTGVALASWVLTWGPWLRVGDRLLEIPLPYQLVYRFVPFFSRFQWPPRFMALGWLALAVLAAMGLARLRSSRAAAAAVALVLAEMALRGVLPVPLTPWHAPQVYRDLAAEPLAGALVLPLGHEGSHVPLARNFYQTVHGKKVYDGAAAYPGHGWDRVPLDGNPFLEFLKDPPAGRAFAPADVEAVRRQGYRYVILDPVMADSLHPSPYEAMRAALERALGPPDRVDEGVALWRLE